MAELRPPPPISPVDRSRVHKISFREGATLHRAFDPNSRYKPGPGTFRHHGPLSRFDHQIGYSVDARIEPRYNPTRGVYYAARALSGAVVEVFGEGRVIDCGSFCVVTTTLSRPLTLLDLRGNGALLAGTISALGQIESTEKTQAWSRYFYDHLEIYGNVDGLIYANAHNADDAIVLYERAESTIVSSAQRVLRLSDPSLERELLEIGERTGFPVR